MLQDVKDAVAGGASMVQYRDKSFGASGGRAGAASTGSSVKREDMVRISRSLLAITQPAGIPLIINDDFSIALEIGAQGCHLGQTDFPLHEARRMMRGKIIGVTVHNPEEAQAAERNGADYVGASPIFATSTKGDAGAVIGLEGLKEIRAATKLPILAIGGITLENAPSVIAAGANGICAISATSGIGVKEKVAAFSALFKGRA
jgi:thiamine-phosphate pyrophosphorylase